MFLLRLCGCHCAIAAGAVSADLTVCTGLGDSSASRLAGNVEPPSSHHLGMRDSVRSQTVSTLHYYKHSHELSLSRVIACTCYYDLKTKISHTHSLILTLLLPLRHNHTISAHVDAVVVPCVCSPPDCCTCCKIMFSNCDLLFRNMTNCLYPCTGCCGAMCVTECSLAGPGR